VFSDRTPRKLDLPGQLDMDGLAVSPDGRRVAFVAVSEGVRKLWVRVYVTRFGSPDRDIQRVSTAGGRSPSWRRDQKGLVFLGADSTIMSVTLKPGATLQCSTPSPLFRSALMVDNSFDVAGDAQHFVVVTGSAQSLTLPFTVVANCQAA